VVWSRWLQHSPQSSSGSQTSFSTDNYATLYTSKQRMTQGSLCRKKVIFVQLWKSLVYGTPEFIIVFIRIPQLDSIVSHLNPVHYQLHELGHEWSIPSSWRVCRSLHLICGRPMFRLIFGLCVKIFFKFVCLPFVKLKSNQYLKILSFPDKKRWSYPCNRSWRPHMVVRRRSSHIF
jgi:hypothetical protein